VAAAAGACLAAAGPAQAAGTLDQQQTSAPSHVGVQGPGFTWESGSIAYPGLAEAQTFTAGVTGGLDRVELSLRQDDHSDGSPLTVEIRNVAAGAPGTGVLATAELAASEIPPDGSPLAFVPANFSPAVPVTAGTQYAIVAYTANQGAYWWGLDTLDVYPGGQTSYRLSSPPGTWTTPDFPGDVAFKTYVEPAAFAFSGFVGPVDNPPTVNSVNAGAGVPVKFSLAGDHGLDILAAGSPSSQPIACDTGNPIDPIEETVSAGASRLQYDPITELYTYVWKTGKSWAGSCRQLAVKLSDGTEHIARFLVR
jgi:hypothetical protein